MGDFSDGKNILLRPEPGRPIRVNPPVVKEAKIEQKDVNAIADAVIRAIGSKIPTMVNSTRQPENTFNNSASLDKLAQAMIISGDDKESNIKDMGTVKETKKDNSLTNKTIDLLSKLSD